MPSSIFPSAARARLAGRRRAAPRPGRPAGVAAVQPLEPLERRQLLSAVVFSESFDQPTGPNGQVVFKADPIYLANGATPSGGDLHGNTPYLNGYVVPNNNFEPFASGIWGLIDQDQGGGGYFLYEGTFTGKAPSFAKTFWDSAAPVPVTPHTDYAFSFYLANSNTLADHEAIVQPSINEVPVGPPAVAKGYYTDGIAGDGWQQFTVTWNSGSATTAELELSDLQPSGYGNDFGVDTVTLTDLSASPTPTPTPTPAPTPTPTPTPSGSPVGTGPLAPRVAGETLPPAVVAGARVKGAVTVGVTNLGPTFTGKATVSLYASSTQTLTGATPIAPPRTLPLRLRPGQAKELTFRVNELPPTLSAGTYYLVPKVTSSAGTRIAPASASSAPSAPPPATVVVSPPFVDLSGAVGPVAGTIKPGGAAAAVLTVSNGGNVAAAGRLQVALAVRPEGTNGGADVALQTVTANIHIKPGGSSRLRVRFRLPATLAAGRYSLVAALDPNGAFGGSAGRGPVVGATTFNVS